jgi:hypothetical protein
MIASSARVLRRRRHRQVIACAQRLRLRRILAVPSVRRHAQHPLEPTVAAASRWRMTANRQECSLPAVVISDDGRGDPVRIGPATSARQARSPWRGRGLRREARSSGEIRGGLPAGRWRDRRATATEDHGSEEARTTGALHGTPGSVPNGCRRSAPHSRTPHRSGLLCRSGPPTGSPGCVRSQKLHRTRSSLIRQPVHATGGRSALPRCPGGAQPRVRPPDPCPAAWRLRRGTAKGRARTLARMLGDAAASASRPR